MPFLWRNLTRPNTLPPSSPEIILEPDGIPDEAFEVMTRVGSATNPHLLRSARTVDITYTQSIPEVVALIPDEERTPWADDGRFPS